MSLPGSAQTVPLQPVRTQSPSGPDGDGTGSGAKGDDAWGDGSTAGDDGPPQAVSERAVVESVSASTEVAERSIRGVYHERVGRGDGGAHLAPLTARSQVGITAALPPERPPDTRST